VQIVSFKDFSLADFSDSFKDVKLIQLPPKLSFCKSMDVLKDSFGVSWMSMTCLKESEKYEMEKSL